MLRLFQRRRPPARRAVNRRHGEQIACPFNLLDIMNPDAKGHSLTAMIVDVMDSVPLQRFGKTSGVFSTFVERKWAVFYCNGWPVQTREKICCTAQGSHFATFDVDLQEAWPSSD